VHLAALAAGHLSAVINVVEEWKSHSLPQRRFYRDFEKPLTRNTPRDTPSIDTQSSHAIIRLYPGSVPTSGTLTSRTESRRVFNVRNRLRTQLRRVIRSWQ